MASGNASSDLEIERKYLLHGLPDIVRSARSAEVDQGYIPGERIRERIRRMRSPEGVAYFRTLKSGSGLVRTEIEEATTEAFFTAVWPLTRGARVQKRRYFVPEGTLVWEIDEFLDRPNLWLAEVELERADQAAAVPDWLAPFVVREVTDEKAFTNRALAR
jgi:CYTH domain-containing protein